MIARSQFQWLKAGAVIVAFALLAGCVEAPPQRALPPPPPPVAPPDTTVYAAPLRGQTRISWIATNTSVRNGRPSRPVSIRPGRCRHRRQRGARGACRACAWVGSGRRCGDRRDHRCGGLQPMECGPGRTIGLVAGAALGRAVEASQTAHAQAAADQANADAAARRRRAGIAVSRLRRRISARDERLSGREGVQRALTVVAAAYVTERFEVKNYDHHTTILSAARAWLSLCWRAPMSLALSGMALAQQHGGGGGHGGYSGGGHAGTPVMSAMPRAPVTRSTTAGATTGIRAVIGITPGAGAGSSAIRRMVRMCRGCRGAMRRCGSAATPTITTTTSITRTRTLTRATRSCRHQPAPQPRGPQRKATICSPIHAMDRAPSSRLPIVTSATSGRTVRPVTTRRRRWRRCAGGRGEQAR